ncbi:MAG: CoB--CoM heterodisulfide reductase [Sphingobacteriales bacterium 17-39-43]|uniref:(Fe-S)-binding protein n=1 Tax=Daejeonella sp. TaxID=2805397 RepID=UPI000BCF7947|nr:(Fe-S)-binding protein [Daejeonella sp.]MCF8452969.1 (Fe-S)-binding protein [Pedobacter sp.]OYX97627.1 MAG: CoB--CoM heterodisulfide reductase [Sphingobacteriia bacterium 35-40-5]OYZ31420.1 MAG: CoB--CoM heterodisulfide reductase [Sphingobacteriales bacterium 16-39-50]OZA24242.1 MAG: CoB--CoM heterodisulfide reductase [Sphingobacteriales bacterium 17-39-43]OZA58687.1 MAG: CoB--CoM heterodisulfide reductase [Sphingobacteriales bacterium 39-40-5]
MDKLTVPTMAEMAAKGESPEILFWVGCAGSFDERAQKITRDICKILQHVGIKYAVLGTEESCTGDPAKRAGNEFLFQMQAMSNIQVLDGYNIKKIVTGCPHCFNTLRNEYPGLGGNYEVIHHSQLIQQLIDEGKLKAEGGESFKGKKITFHDPCYLGRANNVYEAPRKALEILDADLVEMKRCKSNGLCCGAGGAQMFKEPEKGKKDINIERIDEALALNPNIVASSCPFCMTMLSDGVKNYNKEQEVKVLDIAEITARANGL